MRNTLIAAFGVIISASVALNGAEDPLRLVHVSSDEPAHLAGELHASGFDARARNEVPGGLEIVVSVSELERLVAAGHAVRVVRLGRPLRDGARGIPSGYPDLDTIYQRMLDAAKRRPDICEVIDLTDRYAVPATFEGRHIFAVRISDHIDEDEAEPAVLIVANHHAREIGTPIAALRAIDNLVDGYGSDSRITSAVDGHEIWIAPVWNPDGYHHVYNVDDFWRKNRRVNTDDTIGVDLNRNYPVGWGVCGGSDDTSSSTYRGAAPASEPETQTMETFAEDRRFARVADIHSFGSEVRYGYGCWDHPWDASFGGVAQELSTASGYAGQTRSSCCLGGDIHLHTNRYGSLSFLWEIGTSFGPTLDEANTEADAVWGGLLGLIDRGSAISGRVSRAGGDPVETEIEIVGGGFANAERHGSSQRHGLFHAHPPAGSWTLRFAAPGFMETERTVAYDGITPGAPLDVVMEPACAPDLADPTGVLNFFDVSAFIGLYTQQDPAADLAAPFGSLNFFDVAEFIAQFNAGCPSPDASD